MRAVVCLVSTPQGSRVVTQVSQTPTLHDFRYHRRRLAMTGEYHKHRLPGTPGYERHRPTMTPGILDTVATALQDTSYPTVHLQYPARGLAGTPWGTQPYPGATPSSPSSPSSSRLDWWAGKMGQDQASAGSPATSCRESKPRHPHSHLVTLGLS